MRPLEDKVKPVGSCPEVTDHVTGVGPAVVPNCWVYATPETPTLGNLATPLAMTQQEVSMVRAAWTVNEKTCEPTSPLESVTVAVNVDVAADVGVPEISPLDDNVKPAGSDPLLLFEAGGDTLLVLNAADWVNVVVAVVP